MPQQLNCSQGVGCAGQSPHLCQELHDDGKHNHHLNAVAGDFQLQSIWIHMIHVLHICLWHLWHFNVQDLVRQAGYSAKMCSPRFPGAFRMNTKISIPTYSEHLTGTLSPALSSTHIPSPGSEACELHISAQWRWFKQVPVRPRLKESTKSCVET